MTEMAFQSKEKKQPFSTHSAGIIKLFIKRKLNASFTPYAKQTKTLQIDADLSVKDKALKCTHGIYLIFICVCTYISLQDLIILKDFFYDTEV